MLRVLAVVFALVAVICMVAAIAGMVSGHRDARGGLLLRVAAVVCFATAVVLNVVAH